jgi:L-serine dehydratase
MGPMRAACRFARELAARGPIERVARVRAELYGSLALTGLGHATDRAVLLGLAGYEPATIDPAAIERTVAAIRAAKQIELAGKWTIPFDEPHDLLFERAVMYPPGAKMQHPNGIRFTAFGEAGDTLPGAPSSPSAAASSRRTGATLPPRSRRSRFPFQSAIVR